MVRGSLASSAEDLVDDVVDRAPGRVDHDGVVGLA